MNRGPHNGNVHPSVVKQQYDPQDVWKFEHHWHSELCDCKPCGQCCFACCCCWCMGCKLAEHLGESAAVGCCCPCALSYMRTKLRTARRIQGNCCSDCCAGCCWGCLGNQLANELASQGLWDTGKQKKNPNNNPRYNERGRPHNMDEY